MSADDDRKPIEQMLTALAAVKAATHGERGVSGSIACPICGGQLRYSVARSNGHIWGACVTPDCVRWIQ